MRKPPIVPTSGLSARLTFLSAIIMAFLASFSIIIAYAAGLLSHQWQGALANSATIRLSAPPDQIALQTQIVLSLLEETPGVKHVNKLSAEEQAALLAPWFGPEMPLETLPLPQLIALEIDSSFSPESLILRLKAEAPAAIFDDHSSWQRPLVLAAQRIRLTGVSALVFTFIAAAAIVILATHSALSAQIGVLKVLRLIGAHDRFILRAFVKGLALRALWGACIGCGAAVVIFVISLQSTHETQLSAALQGAFSLWVLLSLTPPAIAALAYISTHLAAAHILKGLS